MAETMSTSSLSSLCERLRSERLIIKSEQTALQILNSKVKNEFTELNKLIWICRHERVLKLCVIFICLYCFDILDVAPSTDQFGSDSFAGQLHRVDDGDRLGQFY